MTADQRRTVGLAIASLICGIFFLIPLLGQFLGLLAIIFGIIALVSISKNKETLKGKGLAISGIVLGGISILLVPIIALTAAIAIPNLQKAKLAANDAMTESVLKTIASASETYATVNNGQFPTGMYDLIEAEPPYLNQNYCDQNLSGYYYTCQFSPEGYLITATPEAPGVSGTNEYAISTGGVLNAQQAEFQSSGYEE